jgi:miniconductance mechanosensitive channel
MGTIRFLTEEEQTKLANLHGIAVPMAGKNMTNLGAFRGYLLAYLRNEPRLRQDMTIIVRNLPSSPTGQPIEIYAFARDINWQLYEQLQADIFDHIFAVVSEFGLAVFQPPTGRDVKK